MKFAWLKYIAVQVAIPSSILFVIIVICNVKFSSSPLNTLVLFCQIVSSCFYYGVKLHSLIDHGSSTVSNVFVRILMAVYGIFNLDFRYIFNFSQVCFSQSMKGVHVLLLKYFEAFCPLVLVFVVSLCAYLHGKKLQTLGFGLEWNPQDHLCNML